LTSAYEEENIFLRSQKATSSGKMFYKFRYETESDAALERLPLHVRMKLDVIGVKLSLNDWLAFSIEERTVVCHLPASHDDEKQAFKDYLNFLCRRYRGAPVQTLTAVDPSIWEASHEVPAVVSQKVNGYVPTITLREWLGWASYERYALYKTALSNSEPEKFFAVLDELRQR
jgi:hypothetical protein